MGNEARPQGVHSETSVTKQSREPGEVIKNRQKAMLLIANNSLHKKMGLENSADISIFDLSVEERLLRNEIIRISDKISKIKNKGVFSLINRKIVKHNKTTMEKLYLAKEIVSSQKEEIIRDFSKEQSERAHNIDLAANDLFKRAQELYKTMLIHETILDGWIVDNWALAWEEKIHGE